MIPGSKGETYAGYLECYCDVVQRLFQKQQIWAAAFAVSHFPASAKKK